MSLGEETGGGGDELGGKSASFIYLLRNTNTGTMCLPVFNHNLRDSQ